jgi:hypothetical protein
MVKELVAKLLLSREEIAHLYQGGVLSLKIRGKESDASLEISCGEVPEQRATRIRFKTIEAE